MDSSVSRKSDSVEGPDHKLEYASADSVELAPHSSRKIKIEDEADTNGDDEENNEEANKLATDPSPTAEATSETALDAFATTAVTHLMENRDVGNEIGDEPSEKSSLSRGTTNLDGETASRKRLKVSTPTAGEDGALDSEEAPSSSRSPPASPRQPPSKPRGRRSKAGEAGHKRGRSSGDNDKGITRRKTKSPKQSFGSTSSGQTPLANLDDLVYVLPYATCLLLAEKFWIFTVQQLEHVLADKGAEGGVGNDEQRLRTVLVDAVAKSSLVSGVLKKPNTLTKREGDKFTATSEEFSVNNEDNTKEAPGADEGVSKPLSPGEDKTEEKTQDTSCKTNNDGGDDDEIGQEGDPVLDTSVHSNNQQTEPASNDEDAEDKPDSSSSTTTEAAKNAIKQISTTVGGGEDEDDARNANVGPIQPEAMDCTADSTGEATTLVSNDGGTNNTTAATTPNPETNSPREETHEGVNSDIQQATDTDNCAAMVDAESSPCDDESNEAVIMLAAERLVSTWQEAILEWKKDRLLSYQDRFRLDGPLSSLLPPYLLEFLAEESIVTAADFASVKKTETTDLVHKLKKWRDTRGATPLKYASLSRYLTGLSTRIMTALASVPPANDFDRRWMNCALVVLTGTARDYLIYSRRIDSEELLLATKTTNLATGYDKWRATKGLPPLKGTGNAATLSAWKTQVREAIDADTIETSDKDSDTANEGGSVRKLPPPPPLHALMEPKSRKGEPLSKRSGNATTALFVKTGTKTLKRPFESMSSPRDGETASGQKPSSASDQQSQQGQDGDDGAEQEVVISDPMTSPQFLLRVLKQRIVDFLASQNIFNAKELIVADKKLESPIVSAMLSWRHLQGSTKVQPSSCVRCLFEWTQKVRDKLAEAGETQHVSSLAKKRGRPPVEPKSGLSKSQPQSLKPSKGTVQPEEDDDDNDDDDDQDMEEGPERQSMGSHQRSKPSLGDLGENDPIEALSGSIREFLIEAGVTHAEQLLGMKSSVLGKIFIAWREKRGMAELKGSGATASVSVWKNTVKTRARELGLLDLLDVIPPPSSRGSSGSAAARSSSLMTASLIQKKRRQRRGAHKSSNMQLQMDRGGLVQHRGGYFPSRQGSSEVMFEAFQCGHDLRFEFKLYIQRGGMGTQDSYFLKYMGAHWAHEAKRGFLGDAMEQQSQESRHSENLSSVLHISRLSSHSSSVENLYQSPPHLLSAASFSSSTRGGGGLLELSHLGVDPLSRNGSRRSDYFIVYLRRLFRLLVDDAQLDEEIASPSDEMDGATANLVARLLHDIGATEEAQCKNKNSVPSQLSDSSSRPSSSSSSLLANVFCHLRSEHHMEYFLDICDPMEQGQIVRLIFDHDTKQQSFGKDNGFHLNPQKDPSITSQAFHNRCQLLSSVASMSLNEAEQAMREVTREWKAVLETQILMDSRFQVETRGAEGCSQRTRERIILSRRCKWVRTVLTHHLELVGHPTMERHRKSVEFDAYTVGPKKGQPLESLNEHPKASPFVKAELFVEIVSALTTNPHAKVPIPYDRSLWCPMSWRLFQDLTVAFVDHHLALAVTNSASASRCDEREASKGLVNKIVDATTKALQVLKSAQDQASPKDSTLPLVFQVARDTHGPLRRWTTSEVWQDHPDAASHRGHEVLDVVVGTVDKGGGESPQPVLQVVKKDSEVSANQEWYISNQILRIVYSFLVSVGLRRPNMTGERAIMTMKQDAELDVLQTVLDRLFGNQHKRDISGLAPEWELTPVRQQQQQQQSPSNNGSSHLQEPANPFLETSCTISPSTLPVFLYVVWPLLNDELGWKLSASKTGKRSFLFSPPEARRTGLRLRLGATVETTTDDAALPLPATSPRKFRDVSFSRGLQKLALGAARKSNVDVTEWAQRKSVKERVDAFVQTRGGGNAAAHDEDGPPPLALVGKDHSQDKWRRIADTFLATFDEIAESLVLPQEEAIVVVTRENEPKQQRRHCERLADIYILRCTLVMTHVLGESKSVGEERFTLLSFLQDLSDFLQDDGDAKGSETVEQEKEEDPQQEAPMEVDGGEEDDDAAKHPTAAGTTANEEGDKPATNPTSEEQASEKAVEKEEESEPMQVTQDSKVSPDLTETAAAAAPKLEESRESESKTEEEEEKKSQVPEEEPQSKVASKEEDAELNPKEKETLDTSESAMNVTKTETASESPTDETEPLEVARDEKKEPLDMEEEAKKETSQSPESARKKKAEEEKEEETCGGEAEEEELIQEEDKELLTDYVCLAMSQVVAYHVTRSDVKALRRGLKVGYPGLLCRHCRGATDEGKYFFSSLGSFCTAANIVSSHLMRCDAFPAQLQQEVPHAKTRHGIQKKSLKHGSQALFYSRMWNRLFERNAKNNNTRNNNSSSSSHNNKKKKNNSAPTLAAAAKRVSEDKERGKSGTGVGLSAPKAAKKRPADEQCPAEFDSHIAVLQYLETSPRYRNNEELSDLMDTYYECLEVGGELWRSGADAKRLTPKWLVQEVFARKSPQDGGAGGEEDEEEDDGQEEEQQQEQEQEEPQQPQPQQNVQHDAVPV